MSRLGTSEEFNLNTLFPSGNILDNLSNHSTLFSRTVFCGLRTGIGLTLFSLFVSVTPLPGPIWLCPLSDGFSVINFNRFLVGIRPSSLSVFLSFLVLDFSALSNLFSTILSVLTIISSVCCLRIIGDNVLSGCVEGSKFHPPDGAEKLGKYPSEGFLRSSKYISIKIAFRLKILLNYNPLDFICSICYNLGMIMKWETCKKCPRDICLQSNVLSIINFKNYEIIAPCMNNDNKFLITNKLKVIHRSNYLEEAIDVILSKDDVSLENNLYLFKCKSQITSLSSKQSQS